MTRETEPFSEPASQQACRLQVMSLRATYGGRACQDCLFVEVEGTLILRACPQLPALGELQESLPPAPVFTGVGARVLVEAGFVP
jgi:hypothetical protein